MIGVFSSRSARRRAWFGLQTVLGFAPRGFFLPYRYADALPSAGERGPYQAVEAGFEAARNRFEAQLTAAESYSDTLLALAGPPPQPRFDQDWFPRLDAAIAYTLVRDRAPRRVVEVGSGHSTRFLARAVADHDLTTEITAIDPAPRADLAGLQVRFIKTPLPQAGTTPFAELQAGDFLMIDSSHLLMPGSDVDFLFGHVLPALESGVVVHVHDVFLPDDYPPDWDWRGYNEQLAVLPLLCSPVWQVLFSSHYVASRMAGRLSQSPLAALPFSAGAHESSLWLEKVA